MSMLHAAGVYDLLLALLQAQNEQTEATPSCNSVSVMRLAMIRASDSGRSDCMP